MTSTGTQTKTRRDVLASRREVASTAMVSTTGATGCLILRTAFFTGARFSQVIAGGAGGAILTAIIGAIKNKAMA
jgi:hypothetical protein